MCIKQRFSALGEVLSNMHQITVYLDAPYTLFFDAMRDFHALSRSQETRFFLLTIDLIGFILSSPFRLFCETLFSSKAKHLWDISSSMLRYSHQPSWMVFFRYGDTPLKKPKAGLGCLHKWRGRIIISLLAVRNTDKATMRQACFIPVVCEYN